MDRQGYFDDLIPPGNGRFQGRAILPSRLLPARCFDFLRPLACQGDELWELVRRGVGLVQRLGASGEQHEAAANATVNVFYLR
jgi:hypothetical protein